MIHLKNIIKCDEYVDAMRYAAQSKLTVPLVKMYFTNLITIPALTSYPYEYLFYEADYTIAEYNPHRECILSRLLADAIYVSDQMLNKQDSPILNAIIHQLNALNSGRDHVIYINWFEVNKSNTKARYNICICYPDDVSYTFRNDIAEYDNINRTFKITSQ